MTKPDIYAIVGSSPHRDNPTRAMQPEVAAPAGGDGEWAKTLAAARCWAQSGDSYFGVSTVVNTLPPGAYRCRMSNNGPFVEKMAISIDDLLALPDSTVEEMTAEFKEFWTKHAKFRERGFTFKRGFFMWGPPGSGKTSGIWQMTQELVKTHQGIVLFIEEPLLATMCVALIRRIEPTRPMVCVMEDLDALVERHGEHGYLALLDGENQIDNVVYVATSNYPERLDRRFLDRPSRFDTIKWVGMPSPEARRVYFQKKEPSLDEDTLERWVRASDGYSVAHLREVIIAVKCFDQPEEEVFARLNKMRTSRPESDGLGGVRNKVGFIE